SLKLPVSVWVDQVQVKRVVVNSLPEWQDISAEDFQPMIEAKPDLVILGTGAQQRFLHPRLASQIATRGIGLECMATPAACRTYNILMAEGRKVLAALLPMHA
ncbi:MAG: hypothetical protein EBV16_11005, partial [Betaproteobacteria bacterium]|nr:hypothetical protein [Betaproteobacteria bacterium]